VPSLFGVDLPPCGPETQVAYENVVNKLRSRWLAQRGKASTVDLCLAFKDELANQNTLWPAFYLKGPNKKRKPWRREQVFMWELRWIDYFLQEAQAQVPELLSESEIMERKKEPSVPTALGLNLKRDDVRKMWDEWHLKKRAKKQGLPVTESTEDVATSAPNGHALQQTDGKAKEHKPSSIDADATTIQRATENKEDDGHHWSSGGHD